MNGRRWKEVKWCDATAMVGVWSDDKGKRWGWLLFLYFFQPSYYHYMHIKSTLIMKSWWRNMAELKFSFIVVIVIHSSVTQWVLIYIK